MTKSKTSNRIGEDAFQYQTSKKVEEIGDGLLRQFLTLGDCGTLQSATSLSVQKSGIDYSYLPRAAVHEITIEGKTEIPAKNHFYELLSVQMLSTGTGELGPGNAQKTTAQFMSYTSLGSRYMVIAQRATWVHVALRMALASFVPASTPERTLYAALNGEEGLTHASVGCPYPHWMVIGRFLTLQRHNRFDRPHLPFAVFDLREALIPGSVTADPLLKRSYAEKLTLLQHPWLKTPEHKAELEIRVNEQLGFLENGDADYRRINRMLASTGGIRPPAEMSEWLRRMPALQGRHNEPMMICGPEILSLLESRAVVSRQSSDWARALSERVLFAQREAQNYFFPNSTPRQIRFCINASKREPLSSQGA